MVEHEPAVERLEVHFQRHHVVYYEEGEYGDAIAMGTEKSTKLIVYFSANLQYTNARHMCYFDFPMYFMG